MHSNCFFFFFSSRRRHTRLQGDWSSDVCSSDLDEVEVRGHAIEVRVNAESPSDDFMPTPGKLTSWAAPVGTDVRVDTACFPGWTIAPYYDSLLAKVITRGTTRQGAIATARRALSQLHVEGVETTAGFARDLLAH